MGLRQTLRRIWGRTRAPASAGGMRSMVGAVFDHVRATHYASAGESAGMDFRFARDIGLNEILAADLVQLRTRCRYEMLQNGEAKGLPRLYANAAVGCGPTLSLSPAGDLASRPARTRAAGELRETGGVTPAELSAQREARAWAQWALACGARGESFGSLLHLGVRQLFPCGEFLWTPKTGAEAVEGTRCRLRLHMLRPDRLKTPPDAENGDRIYGGVEVDDDGVPVKYHLLKRDPDNVPGGAGGTEEYEELAADLVAHVFLVEDPVQHRGAPWLGTGLAAFHKLRRFDEATVVAAIVAAKFAMVLVNTMPDAPEQAVANNIAALLPPGVMDIVDGATLVPPPGYDARQISPQHPAINHSDYRKSQVGSAAAGMAIPKNIATQDSSGSSFASARFDGVSFVQDIDALQGNLLEGMACRPVRRWWRREALTVGEADPTVAVIDRWRWPVEDRHTDATKLANANAIRLKSGQYTLARVWGEDGYDPEDSFDALEREIQRFREKGWPHPFLAGAGQPAAEEEAAPGAVPSGNAFRFRNVG